MCCLYHRGGGEKLSKICTFESGSRPKGGVDRYTEGALSLGGEHIDHTSGFLNLSSPKYVPIEFYQSHERGRIKKNDVLICKDGALTGKIAIVRDELDNTQAMVNEHVFILRCENMITQKYIYQFLFSSMGQKLLKSIITGAAQGGINSTNFGKLSIPLPPIDIQQKALQEIEPLEKEIKDLQTQLSTLNKDKNDYIQSILA